MMVSLSNGVLSKDESGKQPLVNGYMTKWKPRKVSANRKFPPGCGRNVVLNDTNIEENRANGDADLEVNAVDIAGIVEHAVIDEEVRNAESNDGVGVLEGNKLARENDNDSGAIKSFDVSIDGGSHEVVVSSPVDDDIDASLDALVGKLTVSITGVGGKIDEATNIPIQDEMDESLGLLVGQVDTTVGDLLDDVDKDGYSEGVAKNEGDSEREELNVVDDTAVVQNSSMEDEKPVSNDEDPVTKVILAGRSDLLSPYVKPEFLMRLRDKCRRRKVSAVRDYPPNCGMNVSLRTEEEKKMVTLDSAENIEVEPESSGSKLAIDNSVQHAGLKLREKVLVSSPIADDKVSSLDNDNHVVEGIDQQKENVHGLMAEPHCPWRKGKEPLDNLDSGPSGGKKKQQKRKSASVTSTKTSKERSEQPSKKKRPLFGLEETDTAPCSSTFRDDDDHGACTEHPAEITPISVVKPDHDYSKDSEGPPTGKELVVYSLGESDNIKSLCSTFNSEDERDEVPLMTLMSSPYSSPKKKKTVKIDSVGTSQEKVQKKNHSWRNKAVAKKSVRGGKLSGGSSKKPKGVLVPKNKDEDPKDEDLLTYSPAKGKTVNFDVRLPPFGPNNNNHGDARNKVRETLRLFHSICRKLLQKEESEGEAKSKNKPMRIDLHTARLIKDKGKEVNNEKQYLGAVPGVEVGDEFQYRVELAVVGIHRLYQAGIDWMKLDKIPVATSIVTSGAYNDDTENADVLIYSGQGGNIVGGSKGKEPEDQKLERGNLALSNSSLKGTPVRVVRGWKETVKGVDPSDTKSKTVTTYVYDGLYTVKRYWMENVKGVMIFKFELTRNPDQPELAWKELRNKSKIRPGVCAADISGGKERHPICAVNVVNDEKPPTFNYISKMIYPDWYVPNPPRGCDCVGRCGGLRKCLCAVRNGGEIPYNRNGAIVEAKPLVYECGPHCKCPPTCYNRVSQRGIKMKLEIFKTEFIGWGLRAATSIPSGSFICEYAGELLEDKEAEEKIGNDEYLFDIGQNYTDSSLNSEEEALSVEIAEEGGYTIDACQFGNVGRFVNHSCSPNLYAQNVIYDHDDKKIPHVMLFAAENIPPLQELTYHYNYKLDQVRDSNGNIKEKKCFCGSAECTGRLY